jgi:23S rRNA (uracil1939-C5)-methyltransferase
MGTRAEVLIEKLVHGGDGLCRLPDGQVVFVPGTIPGEKVEIEIEKHLGDYAFGRVVRFIEPSPQRIDPPCVHFGRCGGCQLQHLSYEGQIREKVLVFEETLKRVGGISEPILSLEPSPKAFGYRHRLQFHVHQETGALGFLKRRSHDLVPIRRCLLAREEINEVLSHLPDIPAWKRIHPYVTRVNLGTSLVEGKVTLLFWTKVPPRPEDLEEILSALPVIKAIYYWVRGRDPKGPFPQEAPHGGRRLFPVPADISGLSRELLFFVSPGVFVQANWEINLKLISYVREIARLQDSDEVLDLHCGMGNFLLPLGASVARGLGVDTDHRAISDARYNLKIWGLSNLDFENLSALETLLECPF